ncbi:MAG: hypothetical protein AAF304_05625 [Pseudomonadota bacterium]
MKRNSVKTIFILFTAIALFIGGFYLSSLRKQSDVTVTSQNLASNEKQAHQENALKEKLVTDFEKAFIKQYTPLVGCEDLFAENQTTKCRMHREDAKNEFKNEFIKNRGLPKNTFEDLKLSLVD